MIKRIFTVLVLSASLALAQTKFPITNGILKTDLDANGKKITNLDVSNIPFQPVDSDLTAISTNGITSVGLDVISQPDLPSLQDYLGVTGGGAGAWAGMVSVADFGAIADEQTLTDVTTSNGSNVIDSASYTFTSADIGKSVALRGARNASDTSTPFHGTITSVSSGNAVIAGATVANWGDGTLGTPRLDFGTDNVDAINAALAALPAQGGMVYVPPGKYFIGTTTTSHLVRINKSNVRFFGAGMGATQLFYSSAMHGHPDYMSGQGIGIGITPFEATRYNIKLSDFSIQDLGWIDFFGGPSCINMLGVSNFILENVEMYNCKGNGAFAGQGDTINGYSENLHIENCYIHGDTQGFNGNGLDGDGLNVGQFRNVHVRHNTIIRPGRHGYEGGGNCINQFIESNYIDMANQGIAGINPTGGSQTVVANNNIVNIAALGLGVDFTVDVGAGFVAKDIRVLGNFITGDTANGSGIRFQNTSGDTSIVHVDRILVADNYIKRQSGIYLGNFMNITVQNNIFEVTNTPIVGWGSGSIPAGAMFIFRGNRCTGTAPFGFTTWSHSPQAIVDDNILGQANSTYGTTGNKNLGGTINAGVTATFTTSFSGATPGLDEVVVTKGPTFPPEIIVSATVTSDDTVTIKLYNPTGSSVVVPSENSLLKIRRNVNYIAP